MGQIMPVIMLVGSNLFMTYAWYGHLKDFRQKSIFMVILISWGVAFMEYCLQVPANRLGSSYYSLPQLKVMQEIITMVVFAGFAVVYMKQPLNRNFVYASLCLMAAAYFIFRDFRTVQS